MGPPRAVSPPCRGGRLRSPAHCDGAGWGARADFSHSDCVALTPATLPGPPRGGSVGVQRPPIKCFSAYLVLMAPEAGAVINLTLSRPVRGRGGGLRKEGVNVTQRKHREGANLRGERTSTTLPAGRPALLGPDTCPLSGPPTLAVRAKCDPCVSGPCQNQGTCHNDPPEVYRCDCPSGYTVSGGWAPGGCLVHPFAHGARGRRTRGCLLSDPARE